MHLGTDVERFSPVDADRAGRDPAPARPARSTRSSRSRCGASSSATGSTRCSTRPTRLRDRADLHVVIGGTGPERDEIEAAHRAATASHNVHLVGFIPDADLPDYYRAADVFVLPTRTAEGFGLVLMEAAASGVPSIATDSGAPREIVDDGVTGLLVPPGAPARARGRDRDVCTTSPELLADDEPRRAREVGGVHVGPVDRHRSNACSREAVARAPRRGMSASTTAPRWSTRAGSGSAGRAASPSTCCRGCTSSSRRARGWCGGPTRSTRTSGRARRASPNRHHPKALVQPARVPGPAVAARRASRTTRTTCGPGWRIAPVEVTTVHDTIPFRYPPSHALAPLMRAVHRVDGAPLDARRDRLRVLEAEPAGRPRPRPPIASRCCTLAIDHDAADRVRALRARDAAASSG